MFESNRWTTKGSNLDRPGKPRNMLHFAELSQVRGLFLRFTREKGPQRVELESGRGARSDSAGAFGSAEVGREVERGRDGRLGRTAVGRDE